MDVKDVSNEDWLGRMLKQWEQGAKQAQRRKGQLVRDHPPAQQLAARFTMQVQMAALRGPISSSSSSSSSGMMATSQLPLPYGPCVRPASELEPIMIADMQLETHHRGKRVALRVLTPPDRMTAVMAIVEDEQGTAVLLQSYYQPAEAVVPADEIMRAGDVFIVKEPFFKTATDGSYTVRVDHLGDLIRLADGDERIPRPWARRANATQLVSKDMRLQGNAAVQAMKWAEAHRLYTSAIKTAQTTEDEQLAHLNRSLTNLRLNRPAEALKDAELAMKDSTATLEKGLFRAARASYELRDFARSFEALQRLVTDWPENVAAKAELDRVKARLREQETGEYAFRQMYKQARATPPLIDCATFSAPVEIRASPGRGNGLYTTVPVSAGQLLVCEEAFGYAYASEDQAGTMSLMVNMSTKNAVMGGQVQVLNQLIQKMYDDPRARDLCQQLHHGDYEVPIVADVDGHPVIDSFLVAQILSLNAFGAPRTSREAHSGRSARNGEDQAAAAKTKFATSGLWPLASRINHSCVGNCRRSFIGDMQIIRAARDLDAGTELLFGYRSPQILESYAEVQKGLASWGFTCACELCLSRKQTTTEALARRKTLHKRLEKLLAGPQGTKPAAAQQVLAQMEETYPSAARAIRLELWAPYFALAAMSLEGGKPAECIRMIVKGMESLGFVITATLPTGGGGRKNTAKQPSVLEITHWGFLSDMVPWAFLHLYGAYEALAASKEVLRAARDYAGIAYSILVGERDTLGEEFPQLA
ncbi:TPR domain protein [Microdochium bolleyi]|uniref:TPR domain protein n=1 Tax=Microdochium bolleyi TaxID=196109 RepID=A0A136IUE4_9PEZI|nr:TPR domain protein [Microdochium bolleyi]